MGTSAHLSCGVIALGMNNNTYVHLWTQSSHPDLFQHQICEGDYGRCQQPAPVIGDVSAECFNTTWVFLHPIDLADSGTSVLYHEVQSSAASYGVIHRYSNIERCKCEGRFVGNQWLAVDDHKQSRRF